MVVIPISDELVDDRVQNHQPLGNPGIIHGVLTATLLVSYLISLTVIIF